MAQGAGAVRDARVEDAAVVGAYVVFGRAVQEDVEVGADVHVAQLEGSREGEDEGDELLLGGRLADDLDVGFRA